MAKLNPFAEALAKLGSRSVRTSAMTSAEWADVPAGLRERAFFSARVENATFIQSVQALVEKILQPQTVERDGKQVTEGLNLATARAELKGILESINYKPEAGKAGTIEDLSSSKRLNLLLRTQTEMAQGYGQHIQSQAAGVLDAWPAQELFRAEERKEERDWRTRWMQDGGQVFSGGRMIALKNDPIWSAISRFGTPYPPFDFRSGMWLRDVDRAEAEELGLLAPGAEVASSIEDFNARLEASAEGLHPDLLASLTQSLGNQVQVVNGRIKWRNN